MTSIKTKQYISVTLAHIFILSSCFTQSFAADNRVRNNVIIPKDSKIDIGKSANGTDVVNILNPNKDGVSHNKFNSFDVNSGVILNNSMVNGVSQTGGFVMLNPNLSNNANVIITEILSGAASQLNGSVEVFGKSADLIFANENGFTLNGASFINANGTTLTTGYFNRNNELVVKSNAGIQVLEGGAGTNGDYFNIISRSMKISGGISSLDDTTPMSLNLISGLNKVDLSSKNNPNILESYQSSSQKPEYAIDASALGSMYANTIRLISTESGVGVRHQGVIKSAEDVLLKANGNVDTNIIISSNSNVDINGDNITTSYISASKKANLQARENIVNKGVINGDKVSLKAKSFTNNATIDPSLELEDIDSSYIIANTLDLNVDNINNAGAISTKKLNVESNDLKNLGTILAQDTANISSKHITNNNKLLANSLNIDSDDFTNIGSLVTNNAYINTKQLENKGTMESIYDFNIDTNSMKNSGRILANNDINIKLNGVADSNTFDNATGEIIGQNNLIFTASNIYFGSNFGKFYSNGTLKLNSDKDILIHKTMQNPGSIWLNAKNHILNNSLIASNGVLRLQSNTMTNSGYMWSGGGISLYAIDNFLNNGTLDSMDTMELKSLQIDNNGEIFGEKDIYVVTKTLNNNTKYNGEVKFSIKDEVDSYGRTEYGDTTFKVWDFHFHYKPLAYENKLGTEKMAVIRSGGNLIIDTTRETLLKDFSERLKNGGLPSDFKKGEVNNKGFIGAMGVAKIDASVKNITESKSYSVKDLLKQIKLTDKIVAKEWLGNWNTNGTSYYSSGVSIYDILVDISSNGMKNHQKDGIWDAIKNAASKDEALHALLSSLLGGDYVVKKSPPRLDEWNDNAEISFMPDKGARILSGKDMLIDGKDVINSNSGKGVDKNIGAIVDSGKLSDDILSQSMPKVDNSPIFSIAKLDNDKKVQYYIETNLEYVDMSNFYGSSYFFSQIGYDPDSPVVVIGDAYYENKLINNMFNNMLNSSMSLGTGDIKTLMDNAADIKGKFGLKVGVELTEEQISKLDKDIIWYVETTINGQKVLTPKVYLSQETLDKNKTPNKAYQSQIASGGNMLINADNVANAFGNMTAKDNVLIDAKNKFENLNSQVSGDNVLIDAKKVTIDTLVGGNNKDEDSINKSKISGNKVVSVVSKEDLDITNSDIIGNDKDSIVNLESTEGAVNIKNGYLNKMFSKTLEDGITTSITGSSEVSSSNIKGGNVNIEAKKDVNILASNIKSTMKDGLLYVKSKEGDVNIGDAQNKTYEKRNSKSSVVNLSGLSVTTSSKSYSSTSLSQGSNLVSESGELVIDAKNKVNIKGSVLSSEKDALIRGKLVNITDGRSTIDGFSETVSSNPFGVSRTTTSINNSLSSGSNISSNGGSVFVLAEDDINVVGSNIFSKDKAYVLSKNGDVKFKAGRNDLNTKETSMDFGLVASAEAGVAGYEASAGFDGATGSTHTDIVNGSATNNSLNNTTTSGAMLSDSLANAEVGLKFGFSDETMSKTTWTNSTIKGGGAVVDAKEVLDIGGLDVNLKEDGYFKGKIIESTKYVNKSSSNKTSLELYAKQGADVTSNIASLANQISGNIQNVNAGKNLNAGILAGQAASNAANMIMGDLAAGISEQKVGFDFINSNYSATSENITNLNAGGKLHLKSTEGDITLNGVIGTAKKVVVDSKKKLNLNAAKSTETNESYGFGAEFRFEQGTSVNALTGAGADLGAGGSVNGSYSKSEKVSHTNSLLKGTEHTYVKTGGDVNLSGGNIYGKKLDLDIKGNTNINSVVDTFKSNGFSLDVGLDTSLGVASNTIVRGDLSGNVGFGYNKGESNLVNQQSGMVSQNEIGGSIKGDLNLNGGVLGSENKLGNVNVGGKTNVKDVALFERSDGANVGISGGAEGNFGSDINIDDHIDKNGILKSGINVAINNKINDQINNDIKNTQTMKDTSWAGGSMNFTIPANDIKNGFKKDSYDISDINKDNLMDKGKYTQKEFISETNNTDNANIDKLPNVNGYIKNGFKKDSYDISDINKDNLMDKGKYTQKEFISETKPNNTDNANIDKLPNVNGYMDFKDSELYTNINDSINDKLNDIKNNQANNALQTNQNISNNNLENNKNTSNNNLNNQSSAVAKPNNTNNKVHLDDFISKEQREEVVSDYFNDLDYLKDINTDFEETLVLKYSQEAENLLTAAPHKDNEDSKNQPQALNTANNNPPVVDRSTKPNSNTSKEIPSRKPISLDNKAPTDGDKKDIKDLLDRVNGGIGDINKIEDVSSILTSIVDNKVYQSLNGNNDIKKQFGNIMSEVGKNLKKYEGYDSYDNFTNDITKEVINNILNNEKFLSYLKSDLSNRENRRELVNAIESEYSKVLQGKGLNGIKAQIVIKDDMKQVGSYQSSGNTNVLSISGKANLNPIRLSNVALHELTHGRQEVFIKNKDKLPQNILSAQNIYSLNYDNKNYFSSSYGRDIYVNQPVEKEAFTTGDNFERLLKDKFPELANGLKNDLATDPARRPNIFKRFFNWFNNLFVRKSNTTLVKFYDQMVLADTGGDSSNSNNPPVVDRSTKPSLDNPPPLPPKNNIEYKNDVDSASDRLDILDVFDRVGKAMDDNQISLEEIGNIMLGIINTNSFDTQSNTDEVSDEAVRKVYSKISDKRDSYSKDYDEFTKQIDDKAYNYYISNSDHIKNLNKDLSQYDNARQVVEDVIDSYTKAIQEKIPDATLPVIVEKEDSDEFEYGIYNGEEAINMPRTFYEGYFSHTIKDGGIQYTIFDTAFHEMRHKLQRDIVYKYLDSSNKEADKIRDFGNIIYSNLLFYALGDDTYGIQPVEEEAFAAGKDAQNKLFLYLAKLSNQNEQKISSNSIADDKQISDSMQDTNDDFISNIDKFKNPTLKIKDDNFLNETENTNNNPPSVDRNTKPKNDMNIIHQVPSRSPKFINNNKYSLSDGLDTIDLIKRIGKEFRDLNLNQKADLIDYGLVKSQSSNNARETLLGDVIRLEANKQIFTPFGEMLVNNNPEVMQYKNLLNDVSNIAVENLVFSSNMKELLDKDYRLIDNYKDLFTEMSDKWIQSINNAGIATQAPNIRYKIDANTISFNHFTNELVIPRTFSKDFAFIANQDKALESAIETGFHELTHKFQSSVIENQDILKQDVRDVARILNANGKYYFDGSSKEDIELYKKQALEAEAYQNGKNTLDTFINSQNGDLETFGVATLDDFYISDSDSESDLDSDEFVETLVLKYSEEPEFENYAPNESRNKSTRKKRQDSKRSLKLANKDTDANQALNITLEPGINNNLESTLIGKPSFGKMSLVYGVDVGRQLLLNRIPDTEIVKKPLVGDDYLNYLNNNSSAFAEFANIVSSNKLDSEYISRILNYKEKVDDLKVLGTNSIPKEDNKKLLIDVLNKQDAIEALQTVSNNAAESDFIIEQATSHYPNLLKMIDNVNAFMINEESPYPDIKSSNLTQIEKNLFDKYSSIITDSSEETFFYNKTISVLDNTINNGGKIYFTLDGIVNEIYNDWSVSNDINFSKLEEALFDKSSQYYNSITSQELRYVYDNYRDHPNIKFFIGDHIIENPLKYLNKDKYRYKYKNSKHSKNNLLAVSIKDMDNSKSHSAESNLQIDSETQSSIDIIKRIGSKFEKLSLQKQASLIKDNLLNKNNLLKQTEDGGNLLIREAANKYIFTPFGKQLKTGGVGVDSYKSLLDKVSNATIEKLLNDRDFSDMKDKNYDDDSSYKDVMIFVSDAFTRSMKENGINASFPKVNITCDAKHICYVAKENTILIPENYNNSISKKNQESNYFWALEAGFHELTHKFQTDISSSKNKKNLGKDISSVATIMRANFDYYDPTDNYDSYQGQVIENDAINNSHKMLSMYKDGLKAKDVKINTTEDSKDDLSDNDINEVLSGFDDILGSDLEQDESNNPFEASNKRDSLDSNNSESKLISADLMKSSLDTLDFFDDMLNNL
ncbi:MAG: hemagglutinin repeat-containing protein [Helicobacteraceae bacterium]|nr:hemagglutinin repeat-containing protein [Helicobacteraceae bacterium]